MPLYTIAPDGVTRIDGESTLLSLFHSFPDSVLLVSPEGIVLDANEAFSRRHNKTLKECLGAQVFELLPKDSVADREKMFRESVRTAKPFTFDDKANGRFIRHTLYPFKSIDGSVDRILVIAQDITDIGQLLKKEQLFTREIINAIPGTFYIVDANARLVAWNDELRVSAFGKTEEEMSGSFATDSIHPDDRTRVLEKMQDIITNDTELIDEFRVLRSCGTLVQWRLMTGKRVMIDGSPCVVGVGVDITDRKRAEEELLQSEERFRTLFEKHSAMKILLDPYTGDILNANQAAADFYGYSVDELGAMNILKITTVTAEAVKGNLLKMRTSAQQKFSFVHVKKDGSLVNVEVFTSLVSYGGREVLYHIVQDVTERTHMATALMESEHRFRSLFEDHSAIMILLDPETAGIDDANRSAAEFYGLPVEVLRTMKITDLTAASPEKLRNELEGWRVHEAIHLESRHLKADGSIRDVEIFGKKIRINGKDLVFDIVHDVTQRNRLESVSQMRIRLLNFASRMTVQELLQATTDELEWLTESSLAFAFFVGENQSSFTRETYSTSTLLNNGNVRKKGEDYPLSSAGLWADAVRKRQAVIHNDFLSLMRDSKMPDGHVEIQRELSVPVIRDNKVVALFGVGNKKSDYQEEEIAWVSELADQAWDLIESKLESEEKKKLADQLQQAAKMEMIGQLAAGIAHEINNPLNFIAINQSNQETDFHDLQEMVADYREIIDKYIEVSADVEEVIRLRNKERDLDIDYLLSNIPKTLELTKQGVGRITAITKSMRNYSFSNEKGALMSSDLNKVISESLLLARNEYRDVAAVE